MMSLKIVHWFADMAPIHNAAFSIPLHARHSDFLIYPSLSLHIPCIHVYDLFKYGFFFPKSDLSFIYLSDYSRSLCRRS